MAKLVSLLLKALLPRFLFLGHGMFCIWLVTELKSDPRFWYLTICLGLLVVEGILNAVYRKGREFDWFCPSAFLYCVVVITVLATFRETAVECILKEIPESKCSTRIQGTSAFVELLNGLSDNRRASVIEQTALLVLIVGRWLLPKGSISREQFSQILLIYVGTAADIVEFSEIYGEDDVQKLKNDRQVIYGGVMVVWGWSVLQFSLTIALPEQGLKKDDDEDQKEEEDFSTLKWQQTNRVVPMTYMHYKSLLRQGWDSGQNLNGGIPNNFENRKQDPLEKEKKKFTSSLNGAPKNFKKGVSAKTENAVDGGAESDVEEKGCLIKRQDVKNCLVKHLELITCMVPVVMQDGPFFVFRIVLIAHFGVVTEMIILLTCKNALVVIVQIYRILIIYCVEPREAEPDIEDPSVRVRTAMNATHRLSEKSFRNTRGSVAIHAISRMQAQLLQKRHAQASTQAPRIVKNDVGA